MGGVDSVGSWDDDSNKHPYVDRNGKRHTVCFTVKIRTLCTHYAGKFTTGRKKEIPPFFLRKCNYDSNEIYMDDSYIFHKVISPQSRRHFQHIFANVEQDAVYQCCKIPCFNFGAHLE
jgi:hypothetical protein